MEAIKKCALFNKFIDVYIIDLSIIYGKKFFLHLLKVFNHLANYFSKYIQVILIYV